MADGREITFREPNGARSVISASVMPSEKYSWAGSPERFVSGRTANDSIRDPGLPPRRRSRTRNTFQEKSAAARTTTEVIAIVQPTCHRRECKLILFLRSTLA